jgi:DNA-binding transcriptional LysR family regulator
MHDLDLLRPSVAFAMVVEAGSFKGAAERLGLSAPYVSQMISDLEARLGRQLLYRSTRSISLTDSGAKFLIHAQTLADAFREGISDVREERLGLSGSLRVSAPTVLVSPVFTRLVHRFAQQHPGLRMQIDFDDKAVDPVASRVDLAIRVGDPGNDPRLARKLFVTRGLVCCSPDEARQIRKPHDLDNRMWFHSPITLGELCVDWSAREAEHGETSFATGYQQCRDDPRHAARRRRLCIVSGIRGAGGPRKWRTCRPSPRLVGTRCSRTRAVYGASDSTCQCTRFCRSGRGNSWQQAGCSFRRMSWQAVPVIALGPLADWQAASKRRQFPLRAPPNRPLRAGFLFLTADAANGGACEMPSIRPAPDPTPA